MASSSTQHVQTIHPFTASLLYKLQMLPPLSSDYCIYHAPDGMRVSNHQHFTPRIVSIGPIHYLKKKLKPMEHLKERYLVEFLQLSSRIFLDDYVRLILYHERKLRDCYSHAIELDSEKFVKMVLVDAAFLIMILLYDSFSSLMRSTDRIFGKPEMVYGIRWDMVMLENQLPFFILVELYKFSQLHSSFFVNFDEDTAMTVFAHSFLKRWISPTITGRLPPLPVKHILDLLRSCSIPTAWVPQRYTSGEILNIPCLEKLYQAGVKIKVGSKENMFDIRFYDGILEIPPIQIHDTTELMFRNLLAFEQCHFLAADQFFPHYVEMMRLFTLSSADTELLSKYKVIDNRLPNAERVSRLFQNMNTGNIINMSYFPYNEVIEGLSEYYSDCWNRWKATAKHKYFNAPWAICSVSAAVLLIVLTIVQTVFTIFQVVLPK